MAELISELREGLAELKDRFSRQNAELAEEHERREEAERRLAELEAELECLKSGG